MPGFDPEMRRLQCYQWATHIHFFLLFLSQGSVFPLCPEILYIITKWSCSASGSLWEMADSSQTRNLCPWSLVRYQGATSPLLKSGANPWWEGEGGMLHYFTPRVGEIMYAPLTDCILACSGAVSGRQTPHTRPSTQRQRACSSFNRRITFSFILLIVLVLILPLSQWANENWKGFKNISRQIWTVKVNEN